MVRSRGEKKATLYNELKSKSKLSEFAFIWEYFNIK